MATHEEQHKGVVLLRFIFNVGRGHRLAGLHCHGAFAEPSSRRAAQVIGHTPRGDLNQPAARIVGNALLRPLYGRCHQRLLHGILGGCEIMETADDRAEHLRRKLAQQMLGSRVPGLGCHKSLVTGIRAAQT